MITQRHRAGIDSLVALLGGFGIRELVRTGAVAIRRGSASWISTLSSKPVPCRRAAIAGLSTPRSGLDARPHVLRQRRRSAALAGQTVAVIGYGSQGHAHALNLHESGVDVVVGLAPGHKEPRACRGRAGLRVADVADAVKAADVVMILVPDTGQKAVYDAEIAPNLRAGQLLMFAHGFNIHFGRIDPPGIDVGMVAPGSRATCVPPSTRRAAGVPALFAVEQDASRAPPTRTLAYARAIGSTRAGVLETTFAEETETDLFGEQSVLCGGTAALVKMAFETLVEAGYQPELAYFETMHELKLIVDLMYRGGLNFMRFSVSDTAEYGDYVSGPRIIDGHVRETMQQVLKEIQDGTFAEALDRGERQRPGRVRAPAGRRPRSPDRTGRQPPPRPDAVPEPGRSRGRPGPGVGHHAGGVAMSAAPERAPRRSIPRPAGPFVAAGSVRIFDTTLRDGEQAPGAGLTAAEKLEVARQLVRLKVDVIEAGFPAASPGDFEAVRRIAQETRVGSPWPRWPAARTAIRSAPSRPSRSPSGRTSTSSSPRATSTSSTSCGSIARPRSGKPFAGFATGANSWAAMPRSSSAPRTPRAPTSTT